MNKKLAIGLAVLVVGLFIAIYSGQNSARKTLNQPPQTTPNGTVTTSPEPGNSGLATYPNQPISALPNSAITVKYLIDHRSALNGKTVTVKGLVVANWADARNCPSPDLVELLCPQPFIFLADSTDPNRDPYYDLRVRLNEEDKGYAIGKNVTIKGIVEGSKESVLFVKSY